MLSEFVELKVTKNALHLGFMEVIIRGLNALSSTFQSAHGYYIYCWNIDLLFWCGSFFKIILYSYAVLWKEVLKYLFFIEGKLSFANQKHSQLLFVNLLLSFQLKFLRNIWLLGHLHFKPIFPLSHSAQWISSLLNYFLHLSSVTHLSHRFFKM